MIRSAILKMKKSLALTSPPLQRLFQKEVLHLCDIFVENGFEIRLVGGCVRDMLMNRPPKDIDLSTNATPQQMISLFNHKQIRFIETGVSHGTLTVHINDKDFEITTLRIDKETFGRKANVEFTHDWTLDAERRDLTVNAMSLDTSGNLYDYFEGESDLMKGKVCFVGDAELRIREDYLRILRYFRFYGRIAPNKCNHEEATLSVIEKLSPGLKGIAVERIWLEVNKILTGNYAPHLLHTMYKLNVAKHIGLPDCDDELMLEFEKVWKRCDLSTIQPVALLTTLVKSEKEAYELCTKWKLSNNQRVLSTFIASHRHLLPADKKDGLKVYQDIMVRKNSNHVNEMVLQLLNYLGKHDDCREIEQWPVPKFPITGADLKRHGVKPGPHFGKLLNRLKEAWIDSRYQLSKSFLMDEIERFKEK